MIYVITHKNFKKVITDNFYKTLLVGADGNSADGCDEKDNTGDNISLKNPSYCELTGLYWIWKNTCDDIVGVCHYRRYFADSFIPDKKKLLSGEDVKRYMKDFDIILPHKRFFDGKNALEFYGKYHNIEDWQRMVEVVGDLYPEYIPDIEWFGKEKKGYCYNMFITTRENMYLYCKWLFSILFELEKDTNTTTYTKYNSRIYGFLSERMLNIWLHHNNLKICEKNVYNPDFFPMVWNQARGWILRKLKREKK